MTALVAVAIRVSIVLAIALGAGWIVRRRSAALRHWVLAAAFAGAAALPLLGLLLPAWGPDWRAAPVAAPAEAPAADAITFRVATPVLPDAAPPAPAAASLRWPAMIMAGWFAGVLAGFILLAAGWRRLTRLAARARPADQAIAAAGHDLARRLGIRRPVRLLVTTHPAVVVAWGVWRPTVLLPATSDTWPAERVHIVLAHELAHIARGDWAIQMTAELVRALHWFNPLAWLACRRLRQASEYACDDTVLALGVRGADYAEHLLDLARAARAYGHPWVPAPAIARPSTLRKRIGAMLTTTIDRRPPTMTARALTAGVVFVLSFAVAGLGAQSFATISGLVADESGGFVSDATLTLTNTTTGAKHEVQSDATGRFEFVGVPAGDYRLETKRVGFSTAADTMTVSAGQTLRRSVTLAVGHLEERVRVVTGGASPRPRLQEAPPSARRDPACTPTAGGGHIVPPKKITDVRPVLPTGSEAASASGTVIVEARIGLDGDVDDVRVTEGAHPDMDAAAVEAVREWKFTKTLLNCRPVEVFMTVTVSFEPAQ
ncbi:MAG: TonB family protein [Vicinamibacterales bacterium]